MYYTVQGNTQIHHRHFLHHYGQKSSNSTINTTAYTRPGIISADVRIHLINFQ